MLENCHGALPSDAFRANREKSTPYNVAREDKKLTDDFLTFDDDLPEGPVTLSAEDLLWQIAARERGRD